jgi:DNA-directed RNA polymerase subunit H (RpoH/RPB5)
MEPVLNADIPEQKEKLRRLFRVKATEIEMMGDRGYNLRNIYMMRSDQQFNPEPRNLSELRNPTLRLEQLLKFRADYNIFQSRQEFSCLYYRESDTTDQVLVLYLGSEPSKQVSKKDFAIFLSFIQTQLYRHIILITENGLNPENNNIVVNRTLGYKIEVFLDKQLAFNTTKHAYSPISIQHIPSKQVPQWAQREGIQADKLPMIMNNDTLAKWFGADPTDGFQLEVLGSTVDSSGYYRIVRLSPTIKK